MDDNIIIETNRLSKRYSSSGPYALKDLTISVAKGEVYGFLGPNGAGKSTAIRTLLNFIQPSGGSAKIFGKDIVKDSVEIRQSIGYLSGDFRVYEKMTGEQFLDYMAAVQPPKTKKVRTDLTKLFTANLHKRIGALSKGNRQKIGIIQAFMHEPALLILDEPTDGLDPLMQGAFYALVSERKSQGTTVFVSSHNLSEVQKMCDRVGIIRSGELVREESISTLATEAAQTFEVVFADKVTLGSIKAIKGVQKVERTDTLTTIHVHGNLNAFLGFLAKQEIKHLSTKSLNLEEEFRQYYTAKGSVK